MVSIPIGECNYFRQLLFCFTAPLDYRTSLVEMTSVQFWILQFDVTAPSADVSPPSGIHKELEVLGKTQNGCLANRNYGECEVVTSNFHNGVCFRSTRNPTGLVYEKLSD